MSSTVNKKRKLIFLWTYTNWGGAQLYMLTIMKLAAENWDVVVILPRSTKQDVLGFYKPFGIPIDFLKYHFDAREESTVRGKVRRQYQRIRSEIETFRHLRKYDLKECILHIEIAPWQSWILLTLLSFRRANVFTTLNNFRPKAPVWRRLIWKARFQIVSRLPGFHIFASNKDAKESLKEWLPPGYLKTVGIGYSPIDVGQIDQALTSEIDLVELRNRHDIDRSSFVVLAVGQFVDRKGRWTFLEAAGRVLARVPDVRFVWLMPSTITAEDQEKIDSYVLGDRFIPVLSSTLGADRNSVLSFFRIADIFALPSFIEGLPIALIEAMALRLPSISTNVYAIPEAILSDRTGILIEAGDSEALAEAILRLKNDPALRQRLSSEGSQFVREHFDGRIMAASYLEAYDRCFED